MHTRLVASLTACALLAACATTSPSTPIAGADAKSNSLSFANLSRIEIAQNYNFDAYTLPETLIGALEASTEALSHDEAVQLTNQYSSRVKNLGEKQSGKIVFHRAAADTPEGWTSDGENFTHIDSGLSCPLQINLQSEARTYTLSEIVQFDNAGRNIACSMALDTGGVAITLYASFWPDTSQQDHAAAAAAAIYEANSVSESLPVPVVTLGPSSDDEEPNPELYNGLEEPIAGGFAIGETKGQPYKTSFWIAKTHEWHVKIRATYPTQDTTSEILAALLFDSSHLDVRAKNLSEPTAPGVDV